MLINTLCMIVSGGSLAHPLPGVTTLLVGEQRQALLTEALAVAGAELMGGCGQLWPLTKVLDIGGDARKGRYSTASAEAGGVAPGFFSIPHLLLA